MSTITDKPLLMDLIRSDSESLLVNHLVHAAGISGVCEDPAAVVNVYVALKSKPMVILTGPAGSGKLALVECLARTLMGGDMQRCQMMVGHPYWASGSQNVSLFTEAQARFNTEKVLSLIEEAWQPENAHRVFIACMTHISPAEIENYFSALAFQLGHGELMCLPYAHFSEPIPYPPNLFIIGTMDATRFGGWDDSLLSHTTILSWLDGRVNADFRLSNSGAIPGSEDFFLHSSIRSLRKARLKLARILGWELKGLQPLSQVAAILEEHGGQLFPSAISEALIFLANSWSRQGFGLFDLGTSHNLAIALDLAIAQTVLPRLGEEAFRSAGLRRELREVLNGHFTHSAGILTLAAQS